MSKLRFIFLFCFIFSAGFLTGCSKHYALTTEYVAENTSEVAAEVISTAKYRRFLPTIKTIVIQAPDRCIDETKSQKDGIKAESTILKTNCGIEMAEIERGWAKFGYEVLSWKVLKQTQQQEQTRNGFALSAREAAKKLGADAILLVNSTERGYVKSGSDARWDRRYFVSDKRGNKRNPAYVNKTIERQFIRLLGGRERQLSSSSRLSVTINASVILVSTGQAVWFYEWTHAEKKQAEVKDELHVVCKKGYCRLAPKMRDGRRKATRLSSGNSSALSTQRKPQNQRSATHTRLMKEVISDMVRKFSSGLK
ncbi:MAG: hypothetical protein KAT04_03790 [Methylococcales bacterium]|nr:hypothetical protein [Methylococcales bacterium]